MAAFFVSIFLGIEGEVVCGGFCVVLFYLAFAFGFVFSKEEGRFIVSEVS